MVETNSTSAITKGRWRVIESVRSQFYHPATKEEDDGRVSLMGYQASFNSLGLKMNYFLNDCALLPSRLIFSANNDGLHLIDKCLKDVGIWNTHGKGMPGNERIHVIFIGDSVMRKEKKFFEIFLNGSQTKNIHVSQVNTDKGLYLSIDSIKSTMEKFRTEHPDEQRFILFNSGLHDTDRMCGEEMAVSRKKRMTDVEKGLVCIPKYRELLTELVAYIDDYPAELKVFRTTTAGWMKYGNFGFAWPTEKLQLFTRSPNFVGYMNEIAFDIIQTQNQKRIVTKASGNSVSNPIWILDGYWLTLARPDHTEIDPQHYIGKWSVVLTYF